jgi:hypothetical protein
MYSIDSTDCHDMQFREFGSRASGVMRTGCSKFSNCQDWSERDGLAGPRAV